MKRISASALLGFGLIIATSTLALAEKGDNTAPASVEEKPAVLATSYFQGTWAGTWEVGGKKYQDATMKIGPKNPDGTFDVEYSSGSHFGDRPIAAYKVKIKGQEVGDTFVFAVNNPNLDFKRTEVVMTKLEGDRAKATAQGRNNAAEVYLNRK